MSQPSQVIDSLNRRLIGLLLHDARRSLVSLAEDLAISDAAVYRRIQRLVETGVIEFTASVNASRAGMALPIIILAKVSPEHIHSAINVLATYPRTVSVIRASGAFDLAATVSFGDYSEMVSFVIDFLPGIAGVETKEVLPIIIRRRGREYTQMVRSIDSKDKAIISELRQNSRQDTVELSHKTGIPCRTVRRRVASLVESGLYPYGRSRTRDIGLL